MSDDSDFSGIPTGRFSRLRYSITNLWEMFGSTEHPGLGFVVSLGLAAIGGLVWWQLDGVIAFAGFVWMLLNLLGPAKWVMTR